MDKLLKSVYFIVPYPLGKAPSQRFRFEFFLPLLLENNITHKVSPFFSEKYWAILYAPGNRIQKIAGTLLGYLKRLKDIFEAFGYDYVFIHREATPLGPPFVEFILGKIFGKKIIYDFDDAIWLRAKSANNFASRLKMPSKVHSICKASTIVSCGNQFLESYAKKYNSNTALIPTVVDTQNEHNQLQDQSVEQINIGWTGSHTTMPYLKLVVPVLRKLEQAHTFKLFIISNAAPEWELKSIKFIQWKKESEIDDLLKFHIGIMPLEDDEWSKGKCGFKAIQYMALGIPALVTPVGVNSEIVDHGVNGYHCSSIEDWYQHLETLLTSASLRTQMGEKARIKIVDDYSVESLKSKFMALFDQ